MCGRKRDLNADKRNSSFFFFVVLAEVHNYRKVRQEKSLFPGRGQLPLSNRHPCSCLSVIWLFWVAGAARHDTHFLGAVKLEQSKLEGVRAGGDSAYTHTHTHRRWTLWNTSSIWAFSSSSSPLWQHTSLCLQLHAWQHLATATLWKTRKWGHFGRHYFFFKLPSSCLKKGNKIGIFIVLCVCL